MHRAESATRLGQSQPYTALAADPTLSVLLTLINQGSIVGATKRGLRASACAQGRELQDLRFEISKEGGLHLLDHSCFGFQV